MNEGLQISRRRRDALPKCVETTGQNNLNLNLLLDIPSSKLGFKLT